MDEKTVRNVLAALDAPKRSELHARACARGIREGRRALSKTSKRLQGWMSKLGNPDDPGMEPGDLARISTSLRGVVSGLVEVDEHRNKSALSKLTREKTRLEIELRRKEIELAELKIKAGGVDRHEHVFAGILDGIARLAGDGPSDPNAGEPQG